MTKKQEEQYHHGDLRAGLLEVTAEMIAEDGVEAVTMRGLSQRLGVSRSAPYRHFEDKSALLAAVAEEGFNRLHQQLTDIQPQADASFGETFQGLGLAYIQFAAENPTYYRLMFSNTGGNTQEYPALLAASEGVFDLLVSAIEQGQAQGAVKPDDARAIAYFVWSSVHGFSSLLIDNQMPAADEMALFVTHKVIDAITT